MIIASIFDFSVFTFNDKRKWTKRSACCKVKLLIWSVLRRDRYVQRKKICTYNCARESVILIEYNFLDYLCAFWKVILRIWVVW